jgi:hypothetical protein
MKLEDHGVVTDYVLQMRFNGSASCKAISSAMRGELRLQRVLFSKDKQIESFHSGGTGGDQV